MVLNTLGVIAAWKKEYDNALSYYEQAKSKGTDASYNMGIIMIRKGKYSKALEMMGGKTCKYNYGLAQLLSGNYTEAVSQLECAPKSAEAYYLIAICGARSGNTSLMYDNIKKAIEADATFRAVAKDDREFLKYSTTGDFENALK